MAYEKIAPAVHTMNKVASRETFFSRSFSAKPKPNGTNSKTFKKTSRGPQVFMPLPSKKGHGLPKGLDWKSKRKGKSVKKRIPAIAAIRNRFDQPGVRSGGRKLAVRTGEVFRRRNPRLIEQKSSMTLDLS